MDIFQAITFLENQISNPSAGLPDEVFYFISRLTPLINIDLLIKDEIGRTLLAWRNDTYCGEGWHIPGGIIRFKETFEERIRKVAESELGTDVLFEPEPIALNQLIHKERDTRGHCISLLYRCRLSSSYEPLNIGRTPGDRGFLQWHDSCPDNLIKYHAIYRSYL